MVPAETLVGLQNLLVHLRDVSAENAHVYQYRLWDAKRVKVETAQNRHAGSDNIVSTLTPDNGGQQTSTEREHQPTNTLLPTLDELIPAEASGVSETQTVRQSGYPHELTAVSDLLSRLTDPVHR
ncbi:hypothetical protein FJT64_016761 [Amphibalanus amphitrite]|uniref:Uncharacterized protein n=1 Tax=Amphibalanus amphitrite TaxID=1232801 RepID=A0A6A4X915_AMPAM|nr:hypothetical protein FJT64_016761 [Amphibalanus amphitrite]